MTHVPENWTRIETDSKGGMTYFYGDGPAIHLTKEEVHEGVYGHHAQTIDTPAKEQRTGEEGV
jgi:hypothetical protein